MGLRSKDGSDGSEGSEGKEGGHDTIAPFECIEERFNTMQAVPIDVETARIVDRPNSVVLPLSVFYF